MARYFMGDTRLAGLYVGPPRGLPRGARRSKGAKRGMAAGRFERSGLCDDAMMDPSRTPPTRTDTRKKRPQKKPPRSQPVKPGLREWEIKEGSV
ncbi:hypothetical protein D1641_13480 [Colidextribacter sp. OB.20]|uniref:hypothetical protein n=1 Tax=Colidextribacter sp. OB.20 TaxID=2304568 RepID=UPI00136B6E6F|nr:hypothetical protein [Colidextribacter sp. OB.20]NBI11013.1 hypothetical protein [Colidextribacter sp. OB.20]